jgi:hypothetical protein
VDLQRSQFTILQKGYLFYFLNIASRHPQNSVISMQGSTGFAGWAISNMAQSLFCASKPALALSLAILKGIVSSHGSVDLLRQPKPWLVVVLPSASHPGSLRMYIIQLLVCLADGRGAPCVLRRLSPPAPRDRGCHPCKKRRGRHCLSFPWLPIETRRCLRSLLRFRSLRFSWLTRIRSVRSLRRLSPPTALKHQT